MTEKLSTWLTRQLEDRGWSVRYLARKMEVSHTNVNNVVSSLTLPSPTFCVALARALNEQPEDILRLAGHLPLLPPHVAEEREATSIIRQLPVADRAAALAMLRGLNRSTPSPAIAEPRPNYDAASNNSKIIDNLWDIIPDWKKQDLVDRYHRQVESHAPPENDE